LSAIERAAALKAVLAGVAPELLVAKTHAANVSGSKARPACGGGRRA
jgi:hypothetical protein